MESRQFIVPAKEAGSRLDKWLVKKMPEFSRKKIKQFLDHGLVSVNQKKVLIAGWELEANDSIEVRFVGKVIPAEAGIQRKPLDPRSLLKARRDKFRGDDKQRFLNILFEDKDLIVVEKPAGILTEPKEDSPHEHLLGMIKAYLKRKYKESKGSYVKLLHRLDKDTSGIVAAAKSKIGEELEDAFRFHKIDRRYLAVVEGAVEKNHGKIDLPIEKGEFGGGKKGRIAKEGEGRRAVTFFEVRERYPNATLLEIKTGTGRTHQIRIHLAHIGHPLAGDTVYGARKIGFSRQALHAGFLEFRHPGTGKKMICQSKLPKDLQKLVERLRG